MKWIKRLVYLALFLYAVACAILYFQQERLIFQATKLPDSYSFRQGEEVFLPTEDGLQLHALWLRQQQSRGVILYWHGNRGSNRRCLRQAENLYGLGYDILMPDYRGFGKSEGEVYSEQQLFNDAQLAYDWLLQHYPEDKVALVGYSLGSGIATHLAKENNPQQLFLVAPYRSMVAMKNLMLPVAPSFLMKYKLRNDRIIQAVNCPITLVHGTRDELIPFHHSEHLLSLVPARSQLITLAGVGHRSAIFSKELRQTLSRQLE